MNTLVRCRTLNRGPASMIFVIRESNRAFSASIALNLSCSFIFFLGFAMIEGICFGGAFWPVSTMNEVVFFKFFRCVFRSCFTLCSYVTFFPAMYGLSIYLRRSVSILLAKHKSVASSAYIFETYFAFPGKYSSFCVTNQIEVEEVICIIKYKIL